ncbi:MAG: triose-phosphate isomerase, partial [Chloroflexi bacterium]|nr:triose-phosphate isomerase [Chloroflexota bacterium]
MRKPFVAGNWKMNKNIAETRELLSAMKNGLNEVSGVEKVVCPPFISLAAAAEMLAGSEV